MREKTEREKNKKIEPFLDDLLVLKPLMISLSLLLSSFLFFFPFFFFFFESRKRVMIQTQQFSEDSNTQLMTSYEEIYDKLCYSDVEKFNLDISQTSQKRKTK